MVTHRETALARGSLSGRRCECKGQRIKTAVCDLVCMQMKRKLIQCLYFSHGSDSSYFAPFVNADIILRTALNIHSPCFFALCLPISQISV